MQSKDKEVAWEQVNGGQRWRVDDRLRIDVEGAGVVRSSGEPITVKTLLDDYGDDLRAAARRFDVPVAWLIGIVCIESVKLKTRAKPGARSKPSYHRDAQSIRWETYTRARPDGEYSVGLMQTLQSTAIAIAKRNDLPTPTIAMMMIPRHSLMLGAAYFKECLDRYKGDPIKAQAAYNAGGVYPDDTPWGFKTHAPDRALRYAQWVNDAVSVLEELHTE